MDDILQRPAILLPLANFVSILFNHDQLIYIFSLDFKDQQNYMLKLTIYGSVFHMFNTGKSLLLVTNNVAPRL